MHIVIIGGGIAGLYAAHKLASPQVKITILEASKRLGGRIHTIHKHNASYEGGAGRFSANHTLLMTLVNELQLEIYEMKGSKVYIKDSKISNFNTEKTLAKLQQYYKCKQDDLKGLPMMLWMRQILTTSEVDDLINSFGYESEFLVASAYHAIQSLGYFTDSKFYGVKGGFSKIVSKLVKRLRNKGVDIKTNWPVSHINFDHQPRTFIYGDVGQSIICDKVIFCVTKEALLTLVKKDQALQKTLATTVARPLYRIYARFPGTPVWFKDMPRICTNNALRHIIPINYETGLIMISYTDGSWAEMWSKVDSSNLQNVLMKHVRMLFPDKDIPEPLWLDTIYWSTGAHYPGPNYVPYKHHNDKYIVCGEVMTSEYNAWIEGALLSVDRAIASFQ